MRTILLLLFTFTIGLFACSGQQHTSLDAAAFQDAIEKDDALLVDVRTPQEFASGHIPGSVNIDWTGKNYEAEFAKLDRERPLLLYCAVGGRSDQAREYLEQKGYVVKDLDGGIQAWKEAGMPVER